MACLLLMATACVEVRDELVIAADGSGTVTITTRDLIDLHSLRRQFAEFGHLQATHCYPPLDVQDAARLFPGDDFTLTVDRGDAEGEGESGDAPPTVTITATFASLDALFDSPYAGLHQLTCERTEDRFTILGRQGMDLLPAVIGLRDQLTEVPILVDPKRLEAQADTWSSHFSITLPAPVAADAAATVAAATAVWTVRPDGGEPPTGLDRLRGVRRVSCPAAAVTAACDPPRRLGLRPWKQLAETDFDLGSQTPTEEALRAAVVFHPRQLQVHRVFNMDGGRHGDSSARLEGYLELPAPLRPLSWGRLQVTRAEDDLGTELAVPIADDDNDSRHMFGSSHPMQQTRPAPIDNATIRHQLSVPLALPPRRATRLHALRAEVPLYYPKRGHVIKLERPRIGDMVYGDAADPDQGLDHPVLEKLGLVCVYLGEQQHGGQTNVSLQLFGERGLLREVQVFAADGRPLPTSRPNSYQHRHYYATVTGRVAKPISLALLVAETGEELTIPIAIDDVPFGPTPDRSDAGTANPGEEP